MNLIKFNIAIVATYFFRQVPGHPVIDSGAPALDSVSVHARHFRQAHLCKALELADPAMDEGDPFSEIVITIVRVQAAKRFARPRRHGADHGRRAAPP